MTVVAILACPPTTSGARTMGMAQRAVELLGGKRLVVAEPGGICHMATDRLSGTVQRVVARLRAVGADGPQAAQVFPHIP
jgi:hypothetical protein